jgi:tight adherence protein C
MQSLGAILPFVLAFAAVALLVLGVGALIPAADPVRRRLAADGPERQGRGVLRGGSAERPFIRRVLRYFSRPADQDKGGQLSALRLRLVRAGYFSQQAPAAYHALRITLALGLPLTAGLITLVIVGKPFSAALGVGGIVLGVSGYLLPTVVVYGRTASRERTIRECFPDALDMLLMCVEAGVGLDEAITRVGDELKRNHPLLGWHFELLSAELRAGKSRDTAFRAFSDRIGIDEVRSFVSLVVQTEALGTSMADTLRSMSDDMRQRRLLRAEEIAQKVSTKLSILLMAFILPVLLMVIMAPAILNASRAFHGIHHH